MQGAPSTALAKPIRAAAYVRMSTEHQQYSTQNQMDAIARYAEAHGIQIVRTYADPGKSGLTLEGREGLGNLISDVVSGRAEYGTILVYDVSRWGRFQDIDEGAYYEHLCKRHGVGITYCAEEFQNDGSTPSALLKTIKRIMAGEYSRELGARVFAGQAKVTALGFWRGGPAGFGYQRQLVDKERTPKQLLATGEHKSVQTDRVVLIPGSLREAQYVKRIFSLYTEKHLSAYAIAKWLNVRNVLTRRGTKWDSTKVLMLLKNPKYIGANTFGRTSRRLKSKPVKMPRESWVIHRDAFTPLISREQFQTAQQIAEQRGRHLSDNELLDQLRSLLNRRGSLSEELIKQDPTMACRSTFCNRFGTIRRAYELIGYQCEGRRDYLVENAGRKWRDSETAKIHEQLAAQGASVRLCGRVLLINEELTAILAVTTCRTTQNGHRWWCNLKHLPAVDVVILARLKPGEIEALDYYVFPSNAVPSYTLSLALQNSIAIDTYRFPDLQSFFKLTRRVSL